MSAWEKDTDNRLSELEERVEIYSHFIGEHQMVLDNQESLSGEITKLRKNLNEFVNDTGGTFFETGYEIGKLKEALLKLIEWSDIEDLMFKRELLTKLKGEKEK